MTQTLGMLETTGMQFDKLWVCGLHAGQWPPAARPSPFLSRELQKKYAMPDATPADTTGFARELLRRLTGSAEEVVLSWPASDGESEYAASGLLDEFSCRNYDGPMDPGWHAAGFRATGNTAAISPDPVPPVDTGEKLAGGAYTVHLQSVEPFAAFANGRLGVRLPDPLETGISSKLRGILVHDALHNLYSDCPSGQQIAAWSNEEIRQQVGSAVDTALAGPLRHADRVQQRLLGFERARLVTLLVSEVATERARENFTIAAVEERLDYMTCGVQLDLRIDRIDRLADGTVAVIDYKTGQRRNFLTRDGEPKDLQLIVYADALDEDVGGLALVNLASREISFSGAGTSTDWSSIVDDDWNAWLDSWREEVREFLRQISRGDARINIRQSSDDARPLNILSRFEERRRA